MRYALHMRIYAYTCTQFLNAQFAFKTQINNDFTMHLIRSLVPRPLPPREKVGWEEPGYSARSYGTRQWSTLESGGDTVGFTVRVVSPVDVDADEEGEVVDDGAHTSHSERESVLCIWEEIPSLLSVSCEPGQSNEGL